MCTCIGSLQSKLKKKKRYGPGIFLTVGIYSIINFKWSPVTIEEAIIKVEDLLRRDSSFEKELTRMGKNLIKGRKRKYRISVA